VPRAGSGARPLAAAALDAHPLPTLVVDGTLRVTVANVAARRLLGAAEGSALGDALGCVDARSPGVCGEGERCGGCEFRRAAKRALAGERVRERGFVIRGEHAVAGGDAHLLADATPLKHEGQPHAVLAFTDMNALILDPSVGSRICEGCGRVQDDEGAWHPLHRYLQDHLDIETGPLCGDCAAGPRRAR
jgi:hypothetical protein